jgi:hypothetical protein
MSFSRNLWFALTGFTNSDPGFYKGFRLVSGNRKNYSSAEFGNTTASIIFSLAATDFGVIAMAYTKEPGFLIMPTEVISTSLASIMRRILDLPDLVSVDLESVSLSKIIMPEFFTGYEYS